MNKANVFLLVVVSSLLTYISTATQPAATASVAQEKWEYFQGYSLYYLNKKADKNANSSRTRRSHYFPVGGYQQQENYIPVIGKWKTLTRASPADGFEIPFDPDPEDLNYNRKFEDWAYEVSGELGWHVFQVDEVTRTENEDEIKFESVWHWRRRVQ